MRQNRRNTSFGRKCIIYALLFVFLCVGITPAMGDYSHQHFSISSPVSQMRQSDDRDIPTWYSGDQWVYKIDPLYVSTPNATFTGTIQNFKQKVVHEVDGWYTLNITGQISGQVTVNNVPGSLSGQITGTSVVRVSDLAEATTELYSRGTITMMFIPFPYQMNLVTSSSPPLELYDFPLYVGEQWQISSMTTTHGSLTVQGIYNQSFNGSQWVEETVSCIQKKPITVPAGSFDCYEIGRSRSENQAWYSTEVGNIVKSVVDQNDANMTVHLVMTLQSFNLVQQPIAVTLNIEPDTVAPYVAVLISGQAFFTSSGTPVQNGVVSIMIPSTGDGWGVTTDSLGYYSKVIAAPTILDDTLCGRESGSGGVVVRCTSNSLAGYRVQTLTTVLDTAPEVPSITGPINGKIRVSHPYVVVSEDPENDDVFYFVDWGDGTNSSWVGPSASNQNVTLSHTFMKKGSYTIKVKARDIFYKESEWGTLQVTMPKQVFSSQLPRFFMRFPVIYALLECFLRN